MMRACGAALAVARSMALGFLFVGSLAVPMQVVGAPTFTWAPASVTAAVQPGTVRTLTATLVASDDAADVTVRVVPALRDYVSVTPKKFAVVKKGVPYGLLITMAVDHLAAHGTLDGTIQLREGSRVLSRPLPVAVKISGPHVYSISSDGEIHPVDELILDLRPGNGASDANSLAELVRGSVVKVLFDPDVYLLKVPSTTEAELQQAIVMLQADLRVESVTTNAVMLPTGVASDLANLRNLREFLAAAYDRIAVEGAWDMAATRPPRWVRVAVIDTGIDSTHDEFKGVVLSGDALTDAGSQSPSVCGKTSPPIHSHGTPVAGIIGANNLSVDGAYVSPQMNGIVSGIPQSLYTLIGDRSGSVTETLEAVDRVVARGAKIVNMSFGGISCDAHATDSCARVGCLDSSYFDKYKKKYERVFDKYPGVLFVASAGNGIVVQDANGNLSSQGVDARYNLPGGAISRPNLISVAATKVAERSAWNVDQAIWTNFSNFGSGIDIAAPGESVYAPSVRLLSWGGPLGLFHYWNNNGYEQRFFGGTSSAAPMVSGVAALMMSVSKYELAPSDVKAILRETATPACLAPSMRRGCLVNAERAVGRAIDAEATGLVTYRFTGHITELSADYDPALWAVMGVAPSVGSRFSGRLTYDGDAAVTRVISGLNYFDGAVRDFRVNFVGGREAVLATSGSPLRNELQTRVVVTPPYSALNMVTTLNVSGTTTRLGHSSAFHSSLPFIEPPGATLPSALPSVDQLDMSNFFFLTMLNPPLGAQAGYVVGRLDTLTKE